MYHIVFTTDERAVSVGVPVAGGRRAQQVRGATHRALAATAARVETQRADPQGTYMSHLQSGRFFYFRLVY